MLYTTSFADYCKGKRAEYGNKFIPYFESGQRIEVKTVSGEIKRGYVGITTGWKPAFLLISRANAYSSSELLSKKIIILKSLNKYRQ